MEGHLLIVLNDSENSMELSPYICNDEYMITIYVNDMTSFKDIIGNDQYLREMVETFEYMFGFEEENSLLTNYIKNNMHEVKHFLQICDEVSFTGKASKVREYIKQNNFVNKKIFYNEILPLKRECLEEIEATFGDLSNIVFLIEGNSVPVTLDEYKKTVKEIEIIAQNVRKLKLSPLEEIMYVYDLVRDRNYIKEDDSEEYTVSRDLTSVLFGKKIVCAGFTVLFNAILNCLGYKTINFLLSPLKNTEAHMRSLVYVYDEKYDVNGMYFFDPTYECKRGESNSFLERYSFFARTYRQIMQKDKDKFSSNMYRYMDDDIINDIDELFPNEEISIIDLIRKLELPILNRLLRFSGQEEISIDKGTVFKEDLIDRVYEISVLSNCYITYEKFLGALYNVRKQQYYQEPLKYAFDMESITNILINSKIADKSSDDEDRLLMAILGSVPVVCEKDAATKVNDFFVKNGLDKDMESVRLTRNLKTILDKRLEEEKKLSFKK